MRGMCNGEIRNAHRVLVGKLEGKDHSEGLSVDERIILRWSLQKFHGRV